MPNSELTRRKLLAGLAAAGGAGAGVGTGTSALLTDEVDGLGATLAAGTLDLHVECASSSCEETNEGTETVTTTLERDLEGSNPKPDGDSSFELWLDEDSNSGYVWLGIDCLDLPKEEGNLREGLELTIEFDGEPLIEDASLSEVQTRLVGGQQLTPSEQDYFEPGEEYELDFEWTLDKKHVEAYREPLAVSLFEKSHYEYEDIEIDLSLNFEAEQRRHNDPPSNPFAGRGQCGETDSCPHCVDLQKIENEGDTRLEDQKEYSLSHGDTEYTLTITDVETKDGGDEITGIKFDISNGSSSVSVCRLRVKGGPTSRVYEDFEPTDNFARPPERTDDGSSGRSSNYPGISNFTVSVCSEDAGADGSLDGDDDD